MLRKKLVIVFSLIFAVSAFDLVVYDAGFPIKNSAMVAKAPNDGSYMRTNKSVKVYTESGHGKGVFSIYLRKGKKYIDFDDKWVCIQGKSRFFYQGNWYVIK